MEVISKAASMHSNINTIYKSRSGNANQSFQHNHASVHNASDSESLKKRNIKIPALAGSIIGTTVPIAVMVATQKNKAGLFKKLINIEYCEPKALLSMAFGSICGGILGGIIADKGKNTWDKIKEGNFQLISNVIVPVFLIRQFRNLSVKLTKNCGKVGKTLGTSAAILGGIGLGVTSGAYISNIVNNKLIKKGDEYNRKINIKDFLVHIDDLPTALAISGVAHVDKLLPFLLVMRGYEAGEK